MADRRSKDWTWNIDPKPDGTYCFDAASLAVLMDLRDELKRLNMLLHCHNFIAIPGILRDVRRNTTKPKRKAKAPKLKAA